jgi:hypothetical protein
MTGAGRRKERESSRQRLDSVALAIHRSNAVRTDVSKIVVIDKGGTYR